jgi:hypothetical protein
MSNFIDSAMCETGSCAACREYCNILTEAFIYLNTKAVCNIFLYDMYNDVIAFYDVQYIFNVDVCEAEAEHIDMLRVLHNRMVALYANECVKRDK